MHVVIEHNVHNITHTLIELKQVRESEWIKEFGTMVPRGMNIKS